MVKKMEKKLFLTLFLLLIFSKSILAEEEEEEEEREFYLPYSQTEDVDFSIVRPTGSGCFIWSTNDTERVRLRPIFVDYENQCGYKLDFQILRAEPNSLSEFDVALSMENVDLTSTGPMLVEFVVHVRKLARLEVLALKTRLEVGETPAPFAVAGFDKDDNEFDTLDGLQISWFIGSQREVARFEREVQRGSVVRVVGEHSGEAAVFAVVTDPNYANDIEPAFAEIHISSTVNIEPDGAFLLQGADIVFSVLDKGIDQNGKVQIQQVDLGMENGEYHLEVRDPDILALANPRSGHATALRKGETILYLRNRENELVKSTPVRVTEVSEATIMTYVANKEGDKKEAEVLRAHTEYDLEVRMFNPTGRLIYPSENILCKLSLDSSLTLLYMSESGLSARIRTSKPSLARVRASLRSVLLTETDEELEIMPHVKATRDLEVYEAVVIRPKEVILPFDENVRKQYELRFSASGAGKHYVWSVRGANVSEVAHIDNEGFVTTQGVKQDFEVRAAMPRAPDNFDDAKVYQRAVEDMTFRRGQTLEVPVGQPFAVFVSMVTSLEGYEKRQLFSDCTDVPYEINMEGDEDNFFIEDKERRGQAVLYGSCTGFIMRAREHGKKTTLNIAYDQPATKRRFEDTTQFVSYRNLRGLWPKETRFQRLQPEQLILAVGSKTNVVLQGGPVPWPLHPEGHIRQVEVDDDELIRVRLLDDHKPSSMENYVDTHGLEVTCLALGETSFLFIVGNRPSETLKEPARTAMEILVRCAEPRKLVIKAEPRKRADFDTQSRYVADPKTSNILVHSDRDVLIMLTVKDSEGKTFHDVSSLQFEFDISNDLLTPTKSNVDFPTHKLQDVPNSPEVPSKPYQSLSPLTTKTGPVTVTASIVGYDEAVLRENGVENLPENFAGSNEEEGEDEDWEEYEEHKHGLQDSLDLELASSVEINKLIRSFKQQP